MSPGAEGKAAAAYRRRQTTTPAAHHLVVGVSHPSDDPARHRVFEIHAAYDDSAGGWLAAIEEQNLNAQPSRWAPWPQDEDWAHAFPTPGACLGHAVEFIVAAIAREADPDTEHDDAATVVGGDRARAKRAVPLTEGGGGRGGR